jgi:hypothetical protein
MSSKTYVHPKYCLEVWKCFEHPKCGKPHICLMKSQSSTCYHNICRSGQCRPYDDFLIRHMKQLQ